MKSMKSMLSLALVLGLTSGLAAQDTTAAAAAPAMQSAANVEAVLARTVMDRAPQDTGAAFPPDVGQLVLWMRVTSGAGQTLNHVWFHGDTEVGNIPLTIESEDDSGRRDGCLACGNPRCGGDRAEANRLYDRLISGQAVSRVAGTSSRLTD